MSLSNAPPLIVHANEWAYSAVSVLHNFTMLSRPVTTQSPAQRTLHLYQMIAAKADNYERARAASAVRGLALARKSFGFRKRKTVCDATRSAKALPKQRMMTSVQKLPTIGVVARGQLLKRAGGRASRLVAHSSRQARRASVTSDEDLRQMRRQMRRGSTASSADLPTSPAIPPVCLSPRRLAAASMHLLHI